MNKPINLLVGGLTLFAAQGCKAPKQASQQAEHPNIIYVFPDQYRNQAMGFWRQDGFRDKVNFEGDPVHTPNLDAFARESMVLSSAQSNCPLSSPHRGMLLTGMYPNKSGVPLNCNSTRPISSLREDAECIGDVFSKAGYDCAYFGKLHADFPTPNDPEHPGQYVEEKRPAWDAYTPKERRHGFNYWYSYGTFDEHKNPHYWDTDGKRHDPKEWSPLHESGKVISYLKNDGNVRDTKKPFFIMVGMNPPHSPYRSLNDCEEQDFNLYKDQPLDSLLIRPNVDLSYMWAMGDTDSSMTVGLPGNTAADRLGYTVMDKGSFIGKVGLEAEKGHMTYGVSYSYQKGSDAQSNKWFVDLKYSF